MSGIPQNYDEQVYAALLGKVIGVQYGGPIEGWTDERIWQTYGELSGYVQDQIPTLSERYRGEPQYPNVYVRGQDFPVAVP